MERCTVDAKYHPLKRHGLFTGMVVFRAVPYGEFPSSRNFAKTFCPHGFLPTTLLVGRKPRLQTVTVRENFAIGHLLFILKFS
jgi:hypothetical protein